MNKYSLFLHLIDLIMKKWVILLMGVIFLSGICITMTEGDVTLASNKPVKAGVNKIDLVKGGTNNASIVHPDVHMADTGTIGNVVAVGSKSYGVYPDPIQKPGPDLVIEDIGLIRTHNPDNDDGEHDIYLLYFLVKNTGESRAGESNIAFDTTEKCKDGGVGVGPVQPEIEFASYESGHEQYVKKSFTESPGCEIHIGEFYINYPSNGCFSTDPNHCLPTTETNYKNNHYEGSFTIPDKSLSYYSEQGSTQQIADAVLSMINKNRMKYSKQPLNRNSQLNKIAQSFSDSMATTLTFPSGSHNTGGNNWDGTGGRKGQITKMGFAMPAENIIKVDPKTTQFECGNDKTEVGDNSLGISTYVLESWLEHDVCAGDEHKKKVLGDPAVYGGTNDYLPTDVGVGVAKGTDGNYYITAEFAHK